MSRRLVVDASVVSSASEKVHPRSRDCRAFLDRILRVCHKVVLTEDIEAEWKRHQSRYSLIWLAAMRSKKKVLLSEPFENESVRSVLGSSGLSGKEEAAARKDLRLIEAALETDRAIVSLDEEARSLYKKLSAQVREMRSIVWVNPELQSDDPLRWLDGGARLETVRRLGQGGQG
jgi:hypothetical protein